MPLIVWTHDESGAATYFNRRWTDYTGLTLDETLRLGTETVVHPDDRAAVVARFVSARASGRPFELAYRLRSRDESYRWHDAQIVPLRGSGGNVTLWVGTATDIEEQRRALDEQRYLVQASTLLGASLDLQHTFSAVAALVVPTLADWCAIDLLGESGALDRVAVAHVEPAKVKLAWELWALVPPLPSDPQGAYAVMRMRTPDLFAETTDDVLAAAVRDPRALDLLRGLGLRSSICVPLVARRTQGQARSLRDRHSPCDVGARSVRPREAHPRARRCTRPARFRRNPRERRDDAARNGARALRVCGDALEARRFRGRARRHAGGVGGDARGVGSRAVAGVAALPDRLDWNDVPFVTGACATGAPILGVV